MIAAAVTQAQEDKTTCKTNETILADIILMVSSTISKLAAATYTVNIFTTNTEKSVKFNTDKQELIAELSVIVGRTKCVPVVSALTPSAIFTTWYIINSIS